MMRNLQTDDEKMPPLVRRELMDSSDDDSDDTTATLFKRLTDENRVAWKVNQRTGGNRIDNLRLPTISVLAKDVAQLSTDGTDILVQK